MIADKGERREAFEETVVEVERPDEFEEIADVERTPNRPPEFVLGDRIEAALSDDRRIIAMDHLAEDIGVRMEGLHAGEHDRPEPPGHRVGGIEPSAVGPAAEPMAHYLGDVAGDGFVVVQRHGLAVALESDISRFASRPRVELPGQPEPGGSRRLRPFAEDLLKGREGAPDVG